MRVVPVPCFSDNYAYLVIGRNGAALAVDPAEPDKVLWAAKEQRARLQAVLTTHRHKDHAGGNKKLAQLLPELEIVGGAGEAVPAVTLAVGNGEALSFGELEVTALATPYHTKGHVCYLVREEGVVGPTVAFTGDVLFVGGCGRRFQGSPEQMYHSLVKVLGGLPPETLVYCGHEYTLANLEFGALVDASNAALLKKLDWAKEQRAKGLPTVPSTIGDELQHNVFMRCHELTIQRHCGTLPSCSSSSSSSGGDGGEGEGADGTAGQPRGGQRAGAAGEAAAAGGQGSEAGAACEGGAKEEQRAIQTLDELRRRKDVHGGLVPKLVTAVVNAGHWLGWHF